MPRSSIRRIFNAALALSAQGVDVIRLDIGDPNFDMPARIAEAASAALLHGETHYSPMPGLPALREAACQRTLTRLADAASASRAHFGDDPITPAKVICSQGATQALNACLQLTCDTGSEVLLPSIYFPNYIQQTTLAGVTPRFYSLDSRFQPVLEELSGLSSPELRALLLNSPGNPTGALFPPDTVRALYTFARQHNLWLVSDEAYFDFVYEGEHLSPLALDWEYPPEERRVLAVFSFSKSFAATGLRLGFTICPHPEVAAQLGLLNEPLTGSLTTPLQYGMLAALAEDDAHLRREALLGRRELACEILRASGFQVSPPAGGLFYFLDIGATGLDSDSFADNLLAEEHVSVVPGSGFGLQPRYGEDGHLTFTPNDLASRCIRLCFATPEKRLREGVDRLGRFIARRQSHA